MKVNVMSKRALLGLFGAAMFVPMTALPSAAGDPYMEGLKQQVTYSMMLGLMSCSFDKLEARADELRQQRKLLPDGEYVIDSFYYGVKNMVAPDGSLDNDEHMKKCIAKWRAAYPKSATPVIVMGEYLYQRAWQIRGRGFTPAVWGEDGKEFNKRVRETISFLGREKQLASTDPRWYPLMIRALNSAGGERKKGAERKKIDTIAKEGLAKYPWYYRTYYRYFETLFPHWGGSTVRMNQWAHQAVAGAPPAIAPELYARLYWYANTSLNRVRFMAGPVDWKLMKTSTDAILKSYPTISNYEMAATFGCYSLDEAQARSSYQALAKAVGPSMPAHDDSAKRCQWPVRDREVIDPNTLPFDGHPTPIAGQPEIPIEH